MIFFFSHVLIYIQTMEIHLYSLRSGLPNRMKFIVVYENNVYSQKQAV